MNPASWMLDVIAEDAGPAEAALPRFAQAYADSPLRRENDEELKAVSKPDQHAAGMVLPRGYAASLPQQVSSSWKHSGLARLTRFFLCSSLPL